MKNSDQLLTLSVEHKRLVKSNRFELKRFAYKFGASINLNIVRTKEKLSAELGKLELITERIIFLKEYRELILEDASRGISTESIGRGLDIVKSFFDFIDERNIDFSLDDRLIKEAYLEFSEHLLLRVQLKTIKPITAYGKASILGNTFGRLIKNNPTGSNLIGLTRLHAHKKTKRSTSPKYEKQNLSDIYEFGTFITDICNALTIKTITGTLPVQIPLRSNKQKELLLTGNLKLKNLNESRLNGRESLRRFHMKVMSEKRKPSNDLTNSGRWMIFNTKVEAEFILFCSQTGQNSSQALKLQRQKFKYKSHNDSYDVVSYKNRKGGETLFTIYKSYKAHFQKYLEFIEYFFPNNDFLFPFFGNNGSIPTKPLTSKDYRIKHYCNDFQIPWFSPQQLRKSRCNWLLRRSGDEDITAEEAQHTKEVLRSHYEIPSQQKAMSEIIQFWNKFDSIPKKELTVSVIGSGCNGKPDPVIHKPKEVLTPNCRNPIGCIWCKHHRDIDSFDYIWSLSSYRHLKTIEASLLNNEKKGSVDFTIDRVVEKLNWYKKNRSDWYTESAERIVEEYFHPNWSQLIESMELLNAR